MYKKNTVWQFLYTRYALLSFYSTAGMAGVMTIRQMFTGCFVLIPAAA